MALAGDNKRDYQREYMRQRRQKAAGSNSGSNISEIDTQFTAYLSKKEVGLTSSHWKDRGFTPLPNIILNNPAVPRCVKATYEAISARAFGKHFSVFTSETTLAKDVGVSVRTILYHLAVLETLGFIKRIRLGRGLTNTIVLTLKMRLAETGSLDKAIEANMGGLSAYVLKREKLTMKDALKLVSRHQRKHQEVALVWKQAQEIIKQKEVKK